MAKTNPQSGCDQNWTYESNYITFTENCILKLLTENKVGKKMMKFHKIF